MTHPLAGARARIDRAVAQYNAIVAGIEELPEEQRIVSFRAEYNAGANEILVRAVAVPQYPQHWALPIVEALANARAGLDYLVWELARWNLAQQRQDREPHRQTQFPIATAPKDFNSHQVSDLDPEHVEVIELAQPYGKAARDSSLILQLAPEYVTESHLQAVARTTPLAKLNAANNEAKHRLLRPVQSSVWRAEMGRIQPLDCEIVGQNMIMQGDLRAGEVWERYDVVATGPNPSLVVNNVVEPDLTFGDLGFMKEFPSIIGAVFGLVTSFDHVLS